MILLLKSGEAIGDTKRSDWFVRVCCGRFKTWLELDYKIELALDDINIIDLDFKNERLTQVFDSIIDQKEDLVIFFIVAKAIVIVIPVAVVVKSSFK